jgi:hypothetical protein
VPLRGLVQNVRMPSRRANEQPPQIGESITSQDPDLLRRLLRAKDRMDKAHELAPVPACIVSASRRPHLTTAVSEKRRRTADATNRPQQQEVR